MSEPTLRSRYHGALLGLAAGDALGTTVEFRPPGTFEPLTEIVGGGPFRLQPGQWTDDTSMALCLAESLVERDGFDAADQMRRYVRWYREGYLSSTGRCFDIGNTTRDALHRFERTADPISGPTAPNTAGNGSLMRLAPVPLFYGYDVKESVARAADSSRTTHGARAAVHACRHYAVLIVKALDGTSKDVLMAPQSSALMATAEGGKDADVEVDDVANGSFLRKQPPEIQGSGFVVRSLEAALWAFASTDDFASGARAAVNLGDDADTTGAVYGQLAGAFYGVEAIPQHWLEVLAMRERIEALADALLDARLRRQETA